MFSCVRLSIQVKLCAKFFVMTLGVFEGDSWIAAFSNGIFRMFALVEPIQDFD